MTLSRAEIINRLQPTLDHDERIIITPLLNPEEQIGCSGIDIRLGKQFLVFNEHVQDIFDAGKTIPMHELEKYLDEIIIPIGKSIILHPGKLIIACSFEYFSIPLDIECQVEGRSSWSRLGLMIATATTVEPGFKGVITLELSNTGKIPIKLYPGLRIAQIIFHTLSSRIDKNYYNKNKLNKKYNIAIEPEMSKIYKDKDIEIFCNKFTEI